MLNSLDLLIYVFFAMVILSIIGLILQFVVKNDTVKKISFYATSFLGVLLGIFKYLSTPHTGLYDGQIVIGFILAVLAVAAVVLQLVKKDEKTFRMARILTAASVVGGMISTFLI